MRTEENTMVNVFIVWDDTSSCGLRRLHLLGANQIDREAACEKWVGPHPLEAVYEYQDEAGMWHLRLYWREDESASQRVDDSTK